MINSDPMGPLGFNARRRPGSGLLAPFVWVGGLIATALAVHRQARALFDQLCAAGLALDTLSMGMTADLEAAVHAGSTMVRVGTAIFGGRAHAAAPG